jgi:hypothetical protein
LIRFDEKAGNTIFHMREVRVHRATVEKMYIKYLFFSKACD